MPVRSWEETNLVIEVNEIKVVNSKTPAVMYVVSSKPSYLSGPRKLSKMKAGFWKIPPTCRS